MSLTIRTPARSAPMAKRARSSVPTKKRQYKLRIPTSVYIGKQCWPKQLHNTLTYAENFSITMAGSFAANTYLFKCNGMYDPDVTSTGHQPAHFDKLASTYHHYFVKASRMYLKFGTTSTADVTTVCLFQNPDTTTLVSGNMDIAMERPGAKYVTGNFHSSNGVLTSSWKAKSEFGGNPMSDPELSGSYSTDPVELTHYVITGSDSAGATSYIVCAVKIEYDVVWYELRAENLN